MIVLLSRHRNPAIAPALTGLAPVTVFRAPAPDGGSSRTAPDWALRRLRVLSDLLAGHPQPVVVCDDEGSRPFGWRVAERFPQVPVLASQDAAGAVLGELRRREQAATADAVRALLDPMRRAPTRVPAYLVDPTARPPLVVTLAGDDAAQPVRTARTVAELGFDSVVLRPASTPDGDYRIAGDCVVLEVPAHEAEGDSPEVRDDTGEEEPADGPAEPAGRAPGRAERQLRRLVRRLRRPRGGGAARPAVAQPASPKPPGPGAAHPAATQLAQTAAGLGPAMLHVHGWGLLPAARAVRRQGRRDGRAPAVVLDVRDPPPPGLGKLPVTPDIVIAACQELADDVCERYGVRAVVVPPCPDPGTSRDVTHLRSDIGVPRARPLVAVAARRGARLPAVVRSMTEVPEADLVIAGEQGPLVADAMRLARSLGIRHRVHRVDPVSDEHLGAYLAAADVVVLPQRQDPLTISELYPACVRARTPVVGPVGGATARLIAAERSGLVWDGDSAALVDAVREFLRNPGGYTATEEVRRHYSWQEQRQVLAVVYESLPGGPRPGGDAGPPQPRGVLVGPANSAGQATAWARALTTAGVAAWSLEYRSPDQPFDYPADVILSRDSVTTLDRHLQVAFRVVLPCEALVMESGKWLGAPEPGPMAAVRWGMRESRRLQRSGRTVGLIFHGSDLRRPDVHARTHPWSPFRDSANRALTEQLLRRTRVVHEELATWDGPVMVSTPDLVRQHPAAEWVPVVIDGDVFVPSEVAHDRERVPVVLHLPSSSALKGSGLIDPVLHRLAAEGVIRYRRLQSVPHATVPALLAECDVVVDQLGMGILGVGALEAMATGTVVVTDPGPEALAAYGEPVPLVAVTPDTLEQELRELLGDHDRRAALGAAGPSFVARHHDGRRSAQVMVTAMGLLGSTDLPTGSV